MFTTRYLDGLETRLHDRFVNVREHDRLQLYLAKRQINNPSKSIASNSPLLSTSITHFLATISYPILPSFRNQFHFHIPLLIYAINPSTTQNQKTTPYFPIKTASSPLAQLNTKHQKPNHRPLNQTKASQHPQSPDLPHHRHDDRVQMMRLLHHVKTFLFTERSSTQHPSLSKGGPAIRGVVGVLVRK